MIGFVNSHRSQRICCFQKPTKLNYFNRQSQYNDQPHATKVTMHVHKSSILGKIYDILISFIFNPKCTWQNTTCIMYKKKLYKLVVLILVNVSWSFCAHIGSERLQKPTRTNIWWKCTHPQTIEVRCRWVCFLIRTDLEKFSITSLDHRWILCSEWVPSEWESKHLIKTSQIIHVPHKWYPYFLYIASLNTWELFSVLVI